MQNGELSTACVIDALYEGLGSHPPESDLVQTWKILVPLDHGAGADADGIPLQASSIHVNVNLGGGEARTESPGLHHALCARPGSDQH